MGSNHGPVAVMRDSFRVQSDREDFRVALGDWDMARVICFLLHRSERLAIVGGRVYHRCGSGIFNRLPERWLDDVV